MDSKISAFPVATTILSADIVPIVSAGANKQITVGVMLSNVPNFGNKGITKNTIAPITVAGSIPLTSTTLTLAEQVTPYTLADGSDGQEITLVSLGANVVTPTSSYITTITMTAGCTVTLLFVGSVTKWVVKSSHGSTFA